MIVAIAIAIAVATAIAAIVAIGRRRTTVRRTVSPDPADHARKVARIARQLRERRSDAPLSIRKRAVSHEVPKAGDRKYEDERLDLRDLDRILSIDVEQRICVAESGVTFVDLVAATLRHGLVPLVVPELKTITIGGAVSGCSIESMSFRHGGFHDSCLEYEVVTATGEVLTCTPDNEHALLFQMVHGSFGTLAILTRLTFRLVPAKPFVHVTYEKHARLDEYLAAIQRHADQRDVDFMDGILHAPDELVLDLGRFVDAAPYTHRYDRVGAYYRTTRRRREDFLRTEHYLFRYDRGVTNVSPLLPSALVLRLAQWLRRLLRRARPAVTLDVFVPLSRVPRFLDWYRRKIRFWPLWCVPYRRVHDYEWVAPSFYAGLGDELFLDLAIYGMQQPRGRNIYREIEHELTRVGGIKTLISHNYYSEAEFWSLWNKANYDVVKQRTDPKNVFRDLYVKTCRAARGLA
jgi:FAD/FMN-containing dehydrogenase